MSQQGDNPAAAPEKEKSSNARILTIMISAAIALVGVLVILYAWQLPPFTRQVQSTYNAYVRGQVTVISPQLSGYITEVRVQDFAWVRRDDVLMVIDQRIYRQRVHQAQAQLSMKRAALANNIQQRRSAQASVEQYRAEVKNAEAQARKAQLDLQRVENLVADGSLSLRERDASRASASQAAANIAQAAASLEKAKQDLQTVIVNRASLTADVANAQAALELAQIDLANTHIVAPRDGQLGQISVRQGAYVSAGTHLTSLVPEQMWIIANMKETQIARIRLGQRASFSVDALDHATFNGVVESISPATGSEFSAISSDNATGNFVKISQRIPVRVRIDHDNALYRRLRPGMSVEVNIDTASTPAAQDRASVSPDTTTSPSGATPAAPDSTTAPLGTTSPAPDSTRQHIGCVRCGRESETLMARQCLRRPLTGFVWGQTATAGQSTQRRPPAHLHNKRRRGSDDRCRCRPLDQCSLGYRTACLALTCLLLAACGAPREPVAPSRLVIPAAWRNSAGPGAPVEANCWQAFGDPALSALVEQALRNNTDILTARARVEEYRARLRAIQGDRLPTLEAQINGSRARTLSSVTGLPIHSTVYQGGITSQLQCRSLGGAARQRRRGAGNAGSTAGGRGGGYADRRLLRRLGLFHAAFLG